MKTIILILLVGFLVGCSSSNLALNKKNLTHEKSQVIDKRENGNHISSTFKSTLSSFIPMGNEGLNGDMSWQQTLQDFYMNSDVLYYILFGISFIAIGFLVLAGASTKNIFKNGNKFNI